MIGDPSPKELKCLANLQEWQAGLDFEEKWAGAEWPKRQRKPGFYDPKAMSRAVAKRLGLIE
jgi:hypothetical protein